MVYFFSFAKKTKKEERKKRLLDQDTYVLRYKKNAAEKER